MFRFTIILLGVFMATQILYYGNKVLAQEHRGEALAFMQKLENMKSLGKLDQIWSPTYTLEDGSTIKMQSLYGDQTIFITSPFERKEPIKEEIMEEMEMKEAGGRYIVTYGDGEDLIAPYTRYLWSTANGREFIALPSFGSQNPDGRGLGKKTALSERLLVFVDQVRYADVMLNISRDYGRTWGTPQLIHSFGADTYYSAQLYQDVQIDKDGWIWVGVLDRYSDVFFYVSKNRGSTFALAGTASTGTGGSNYDFTFSVVKDGANKVLTFCHFNDDYVSYSVWKATYSGTNLSFALAFTYTPATDSIYNYPFIAANKSAWVMTATKDDPATGLAQTDVLTNGVVTWASPQPWYGNNLHAMVRSSGNNFIATCDTDDPYLAHVLISQDSGASWFQSLLPIQPFFPNSGYGQSVDICGNRIAYALGVYQIGGAAATIYIYTGIIKNGSVTWSQLHTEVISKGFAFRHVRGSVRIIRLDK